MTLPDGHEESVMKRIMLVADTSNMPAREASIYTGIAIAEYIRDMGYNVSMMADSTSRWAEALCEIYGRLAEMPADRSYLAYLAARLALFYERVAKVKCLGGQNVMVVSQLLVMFLFLVEISLILLHLLPLALFRFSKEEVLLAQALESFYEKFDSDFIGIRTKARELVGKDALAESDKITLDTAKHLMEDYLAQNSFTS
nr:vacuolar proton pump3 [Tanacetum cinerariifolium]